jgi:hypothetical protein
MTTFDRPTGIVLAVGLISSLGSVSHAQTSASDIAALLPTEIEVSKMVRLSIDSKPLSFGRTQPSGERFTRGNRPVADTLTSDDVHINGKLRNRRDHPSQVSYVVRGLYSSDRRFRLILDAEVTGSVDIAALELLRDGNSGHEPGTFSGPRLLGDDSKTIGGDAAGSYLAVRSGKLVLMVSAHITRTGAIDLHQTFPIPPTVLDAFACRILYAAAQKPDITGVQSKSYSLVINGAAANIPAIEIAGHVFVPVKDVCKAARIVAAWNADICTLDISSTQQFRLFPGLTETVKGNGAGVKLKLPPFIFGDQCLVDLDDLLSVIGGARTTTNDTITIRL